ncbi:MAG: hypothetical protein ABW098_02070, partial [Candidatus Thiodiazotropha sp.]
LLLSSSSACGLFIFSINLNLAKFLSMPPIYLFILCGGGGRGGEVAFSLWYDCTFLYLFPCSGLIVSRHRDNLNKPCISHPYRAQTLIRRSSKAAAA